MCACTESLSSPIHSVQYLLKKQKIDALREDSARVVVDVATVAAGGDDDAGWGCV